MAGQNPFNFFAWIRDGVKQAVLVGVSDAVDQIGAPLDNDEANERLQEALTPALEVAPTKATGKRKRLGRTLKDIDATKDAA